MKSWMAHQILCKLQGFEQWVTQRKEKAYFIVIFLLASNHSFIHLSVMNEFLIYAKPLIVTMNKCRLNLFRIVERPMFTHWGYNVCFTLRQENHLVQIYLYHLSCVLESPKNFKTQVANSRPAGRIRSSTLLYPSWHLVSTQWQRQALA